MLRYQPQFSLAALLLTIAVISVVAAVMFQVPAVPATVILLALVLVLTSFALCGVAYGSPSFKAFCIGALPPLVVMLAFVATNTVATLEPMVLAGTEVDIDAKDRTAIPGTPSFYGTGLLASLTIGYICVCFRSVLSEQEHLPPRPPSS